jgi:hypothetical protein
MKKEGLNSSDEEKRGITPRGVGFFHGDIGSERPDLSGDLARSNSATFIAI